MPTADIVRTVGKIKPAQLTFTYLGIGLSLAINFWYKNSLVNKQFFVKKNMAKNNCWSKNVWKKMWLKKLLLKAIFNHILFDQKLFEQNFY